MRDLGEKRGCIFNFSDSLFREKKTEGSLKIDNHAQAAMMMSKQQPTSTPDLKDEEFQVLALILDYFSIVFEH